VIYKYDKPDDLAKYDVSGDLETVGSKKFVDFMMALTTAMSMVFLHL
jgi:hypothetical protein